MERRKFIQAASLASVAGITTGNPLRSFAELIDSSDASELRRHTIAKVEFKNAILSYPRYIGLNSRVGPHGSFTKEYLCVLTTDSGAQGFGTVPWEIDEKLAREYFTGKKVSDVFMPEIGLLDFKAPATTGDVALHDLAGKILGKPVYELMGGTKPVGTPCYSGMIYFDDLNVFYGKAAGIDLVLRECEFDHSIGYRQLKLKIGRGAKYMPLKEGIQRDIDVTKEVFKAFPDCDILVDGNDMCPVEYMEAYLKGIEGVKLFWIEEPFPETIEDYTRLQAVMKDLGIKSLIAEGERGPKQPFLRELEEKKLIDVHITDIQDYVLVYSGWRKKIPELKELGIYASPHAWGCQIKTQYISHLAAAYGNTITIEGATNISSDIDLGDYRLEDGKIIPSTAPGFGMKLLI